MKTQDRFFQLSKREQNIYRRAAIHRHNKWASCNKIEWDEQKNSCCSKRGVSWDVWSATPCSSPVEQKGNHYCRFF